MSFLRDRKLRTLIIAATASLLVLIRATTAAAGTPDFRPDENGAFDRDEQVYRQFEQWVISPARQPVTGPVLVHQSSDQITTGAPVAVPLPPALWSAMSILAAGLGARTIRALRRADSITPASP